MVSLYKIRVMYEPQPIPEAQEIERIMPQTTEHEIVQIKAETLEQAARKAMSQTKIRAGGRLVRYFDEIGEEVFTS